MDAANYTSGEGTFKWFPTLPTSDNPHPKTYTYLVSWDTSDFVAGKKLYIRGEISEELLRSTRNIESVIAREVGNSLLGMYRTAQKHGVIPATNKELERMGGLAQAER